MRSTKSILPAAIGILVATPSGVLADFSFDEIPKFVEDQTPVWIFEILSTFFIGIFQAFFSGLLGV